MAKLDKQEELAKLEKLEFSTPMMQQYLEIKKEYADCLVLFRLGDFYELFLDDAKIGSEVLGIALTTRSRGSDGKVPMCGVPYHALDSYLGKLIKAGYKVAICEQMETADEADGMVERDVVRVVTPGTVLDDQNLVQKENNFTLGIEVDKDNLGLAYADLSTGELYIRQVNFKNLEKTLSGEIIRIKPAEVISSHQNYNRPEVLRSLRVLPEINIYPDDNWIKDTKNYLDFLKDHFKVKSLEGFGVNSKNSTALKAAAGILGYLKNTQKSSLKHITKLNPYKPNEFLNLDSTTITNLELFSTIRGEKSEATLVSVLDYTKTAAGGRKLRSSLLHPLTDINKINQRLDAVEILKNSLTKREKVQELLAKVMDMERLVSRISVGTANPRDLVGLKVSLQTCLEIKTFLDNQLPNLSYLLETSLIKKVKPVIELLDKYIKDEPPASLNDGGYIADGVNSKLDNYREIISGSKSWLKKFEKEQRKATGIDNLKIGKNKVYGFYIQVSKANVSKVPDNYIRKQTLVNSERYILPELKEREESVLEAEEKSKLLEREIFENLLNDILSYTAPIQQSSFASAKLDMYASLAESAHKNRYIRPKIIPEGELKVEKGRHPVVENLQEEAFVPNSTVMNNRDKQVLIITGPNMSGKSTYLRQVALICLMAQTGSFVPADSCQIPVRDQIFTRVGASDRISLGQSTFLVEMIETANILNNCTPKSLIIFDEIGRGTSTYDGMSLAWAVVEYLIENKKRRALTLFATHYHELTRLADKYDQVENFQAAVKREGDKIIFLHQIVEGGAWHSYGIEVGRLAGLPNSVIRRAKKILQKTKQGQSDLYRGRKKNDEDKQVELF
jgi:DNA mismatch repair protein MutS